MKQVSLLFLASALFISNSSTAQMNFNGELAKVNLEDLQGGIADFSKAIALNAKDTFAYFNRGYSKFKLDDYKGAIADYSKAIELNPSLPAANCNRGYAKVQLEDYRGAMEDFSNAIELDSKDTLAYNNYNTPQISDRYLK